MKIGIPWPQVMAPFVGVVEIICGALLLIGVLTRLVTIPLLVDICVALYSTKIVALAKNGVWSTLHEARTDVSMLLGLIFLLIVGGGSLALDARIASKFKTLRWISQWPRRKSSDKLKARLAIAVDSGWMTGKPSITPL